MTTKDQLMIGLRIKGFSKPEPMAEAHAVSLDTCAGWIDELKRDGLAEDTKVGVRLTAAGRATADSLVRAERESADPSKLEAVGESFTPVNGAFKQLITRWQMRDVEGKSVRNDHTDAGYDSAVLAGFRPIHVGVGQVIEAVAASVPRFSGYRRRLDAALKRIDAGETQYVAAPSAESYHTVWFELHQDLIGLLGTTRAEEAAAGRAV